MFPHIHYLAYHWSSLYKKGKLNICIFLSLTNFQDNKLVSNYLPEITFFQCYELMASNVFDRLQPISNITLFKFKLSPSFAIGSLTKLPLSHFDTTLTVFITFLAIWKTRYSRLNLVCFLPQTWNEPFL